ncbi:Protein of unknown function [Desulfomicrobium apsheronum]|uniref:Membrane protein implicated in regulation of membrane protease activity n=1 Tax=Desulfomicrobium apsheronum TaxID=52560 RepID=A0A1I3U3D8_9BACT|nr:YqiJ family protein [Desulfomicrobium apsheronum]SFJ77442.1 Protein of unknown function [Desulfomicrobium apsheronum]
MIAFLLSSENLPFTIALSVMLGVALLEGVSAFFGMEFSEAVETIIPSDIGVDATSGDASSGLSKFLCWFRIGQMPVLILIIVLLTCFGLIGLALQGAFFGMTGRFLPGFLSVPAVFVSSLPVARTLSGWLGRVLPQDETEAVSEQTFIGRIAVITLGVAASGMPAEGRLKDAHGLTHYIQIEPMEPSDRFKRGDEILLVTRSSHVFKGIPNPTPMLSQAQTTLSRK